MRTSLVSPVGSEIGLTVPPAESPNRVRGKIHLLRSDARRRRLVYERQMISSVSAAGPDWRASCTLTSLRAFWMLMYSRDTILKLKLESLQHFATQQVPTNGMWSTSSVFAGGHHDMPGAARCTWPPRPILHARARGMRVPFSMD